MPDRYLVTGGSGYFGCALVEKLRSMGRSVRVFDLDDSEDRPDDVEFVRGDIRDRERLDDACKDVRVVHHNVALVPLAKDKSQFWEVNRDGTENLLAACLDAGVQKVVYTSSSAVFGVPDANPVDATVVPRPLEDYGEAKFAAEHHCHEYIEKGLDVSIIRPRTIMGHGRLGIMQIIFEWTRQGRNLPVLDGGNNVYQFVHSDDLADACIKAGDRVGAATYNIGAENFGTLRETLEGLIAHANTGSRVVSLPMAPMVAFMKLTSALGLSPLGPYHALMYGRSLYFDISREREELEWSPRRGNVEMFCESYDWYLENRDAVLSSRGASHHRSPVKQGILSLGSQFLKLL